MITILTGVLALNLLLPTTAAVRQTQATYRPIPHKAKLTRCLLGVRYGYDWLISHKVKFTADRGGVWQMTVVDVEQAKHAPHMLQSGLMADTNCKFLVGQRGKIVLDRGVY